MFCKNCGAQIPDQAVSCPNCGMQQVPSQVQGNPYGNPNDTASTGLNILACCIPLVGLILWLVWREQTPIKAKSIGKWAIIGVVISVVISVVFYILYFLLIMILGMASYAMSAALIP